MTAIKNPFALQRLLNRNKKDIDIPAIRSAPRLTGDLEIDYARLVPTSKIYKIYF